MVKEIFDHYERIDVLVNNAGITKDNLFVRMKKEDFEKLMKHRNLKFIQDIDTINESKREVWGNSNFQIIVIHSNNNYQIL